MIPPMQRIAFISPLGGSGRTTLVANIVTELTRREHVCLGVDLSPQNQLGSYLGLVQPARQGWATAVAQHQWWAMHALENSDGVQFLPFGLPSSEELLRLEQQSGQDGDWLLSQLNALDLPAQALLLLDTPAWPSPMSRQALKCADVLLVTLDVSLRSCHAFDLIQGMLSGVSESVSLGLVLTGFDARRGSHREVLQTLRKQWGSMLLPYIVHADESIPMAQAEAMCVVRHAPHAQSASDMQGIAAWLESRCQLVTTDLA